MTTTAANKLDINSIEALRIIEAAHATLEPCLRVDHRHEGNTVVITDFDGHGNGASKFTNNRVLFFTCSGCTRERWRELMPQCPPEHRRDRGWILNTPHCYACGVRRESFRFVPI